MSFAAGFTYCFRKYPLFRLVCIAAALTFTVSAFFFLSAERYRIPLLVEINPAVGEPGDIITITGKNFGRQKAPDSFVEIAGAKLTASSYISWNDTLIEAVLPFNVADGPVYVQTKGGRSGAQIFANRQTIPVPVRHNPKTAVPVIHSIDEKNMRIGDSVTITGLHFGNLRGESRVLFSAGHSDAARENDFIPCSEFDTDYHFWSDTELHVRIPDGAVSGYVYVETAYGKSNGLMYSVSSSAGSKTYNDLRTYSVKLSADIRDVQAESNAMLTLFVPLPRLTSSQRMVEIIGSDPEPSISGYMHTLVHRITLNEALGKKLTFSHNFVLSVYAVQTDVNTAKINSYSKNTRQLYAPYLKSDLLVPSDDGEIQSLASSIIGAEKNPWLQAQLLYHWLVEHMTVYVNPVKNDMRLSDALKAKKADAYEFAVLYTALLRATGIPALTTSGILVDSDMHSNNHWWCEFYIEGIGWVPADPALGAGLLYKPFHKHESAADFYFGNLDAQHITFSRGWNNIKPAHIAGKKVFRPKSFALQSIWEETTAGSVKYSSYWQNAAVTGVY